MVGHLVDEGEVRAAARELFPRFSLIDGLQSFHVNGVNEAKAFHSERFGFSWTPADRSWTVWPDLAANWRHAESGAKISTHSYLIVAPVYLAGLDADLDTVTTAMLGVLNVPFAGVQGLNKVNGGSEYRFMHMDSTTGMPRYFFFRAIKRGGFAYLVVAFTADAAPKERAGEDRGSVFGSMKQAPPAVDFGLQSGRYVILRQEVLNQIGLMCLKPAGFRRRSTAFISKAVEIKPDDGQYAENKVVSLIYQRQYKEALAAAEKYIPIFPDRLLFKAKAAFMNAELGDKPKALKLYAEVYAGNYDNDISFRYYILLLAAQGKNDEALQQVKHYLTHSTSVMATVLESDLLARVGRDEGKSDDWCWSTASGALEFNAEILYAIGDRLEHGGNTRRCSML